MIWVGVDAVGRNTHLLIQAILKCKVAKSATDVKMRVTLVMIRVGVRAVGHNTRDEAFLGRTIEGSQARGCSSCANQQRCEGGETGVRKSDA